MWLIYAHKYIHIYFRLELSPTYCMRNTCIEALYNASKFLVAMAAYSCLILSVTENFIHLHYFVKISFSSVDKTFQLNCHDVVINCTIDGRHRDKHHKNKKKTIIFSLQSPMRYCTTILYGLDLTWIIHLNRSIEGLYIFTFIKSWPLTSFYDIKLI